MGATVQNSSPMREFLACVCVVATVAGYTSPALAQDEDGDAPLLVPVSPEEDTTYLIADDPADSSHVAPVQQGPQQPMATAPAYEPETRLRKGLLIGGGIM